MWSGLGCPPYVMAMSVDERFEAAKQTLTPLTNHIKAKGYAAPGHVEQLTLYALYKQAKEGKCNKPKPVIVTRACFRRALLPRGARASCACPFRWRWCAIMIADTVHM